MFSGRTDQNVNAICNSCYFECPLPRETLLSINDRLPFGIHVLGFTHMDDNYILYNDFRNIFSSRRYEYYLPLDSYLDDAVFFELNNFMKLMTNRQKIFNKNGPNFTFYPDVEAVVAKQNSIEDRIKRDRKIEIYPFSYKLDFRNLCNWQTKNILNKAKATSEKGKHRKFHSQHFFGRKLAGSIEKTQLDPAGLDKFLILKFESNGFLYNQIRKIATVFKNLRQNSHNLNSQQVFNKLFSFENTKSDALQAFNIKRSDPKFLVKNCPKLDKTLKNKLIKEKGFVSVNFNPYLDQEISKFRDKVEFYRSGTEFLTDLEVAKSDASESLLFELEYPDKTADKYKSDEPDWFIDWEPKLEISSTDQPVTRETTSTFSQATS